MPRIETEEAAQRLAKAIAADLALYNEEKLHKAARTGQDIHEILAGELKEGRELFVSRVTPELARTDIFEAAVRAAMIDDPHLAEEPPPSSRQPATDEAELQRTLDDLLQEAAAQEAASTTKRKNGSDLGLIILAALAMAGIAAALAWVFLT